MLFSCLLDADEADKRCDASKRGKEQRMISVDNTQTGLTRAFAIISGLTIATVTAAHADSSAKKDGCPYYP
jgi:hypothetical protein